MWTAGSTISATNGAITAPMHVEDDYILVSEGWGNEGGGEAAFNVTAATDTTVTLSCETLTPTQTQNSFFVWFDDKMKYPWSIEESWSFVWATVDKRFIRG